MKCHQRIIREQEALSPEPDEHLKREAAASFKNASVRVISRKEAATIINRYEWLKNLGSTRWSMGLFFKHPTTGVEYLAGVACFGDTGGTNVYAAVCGEEWKGKAITLVRGACCHWADHEVCKGDTVHTGAAASFLINRACREMVKKGFNIFCAFSDEGKGVFEVGTVYQSAGWHYVGRGGSDSAQLRANGRIIGSKIIATKIRDRTGLPDRRRGATMADVDRWAEEARQQGYKVKGSGWYRYKVRKHEDGTDMTRAEVKQQLIAEHGEFVPTTPKHRYVHFAGSDRTVKALRKALKLPMLRYPKRKAQVNTEVAEDLGCSLTYPHQAKPSHLESKQVTLTATNAGWLQRPALNDVPNYTIHHGNVLDILPTLPDASFDGMLSDPPYELGFMSKSWDSTGIAFNLEFWSQMYRVLAPGAYLLAFGASRTFHRLTSAIEDAGFEIRDHIMWLYGTGFPKSRATLKPSYEPIVLARKPANRGLPLNIEDCRINPGEVIQGGGANFAAWRMAEGRAEPTTTYTPTQPHTLGRYPTNVILDESAAVLLDTQTGERKAGNRVPAGKRSNRVVYGDFAERLEFPARQDVGGASRFYYCPKTSKKERDEGLDEFALQPSYMVAKGSKTYGPPNGVRHERTTTNRNPHPTVKPLALTTWLASLIKPEGNGKLLVPFSGSGSEMIGGLNAGWGEVQGVELTEEYISVARARIQHHLSNGTRRIA